MFEAVIALSFLNIIQFCFWGFQNQKLVNKLMSRNFADYQQTMKGPEPLKPQEVDYEAHVQEQNVLDELNALLPQG